MKSPSSFWNSATNILFFTEMGAMAFITVFVIIGAAVITFFS